MPLHFKSKESFMKWEAYKHIHNISAGKDKGKIYIEGKEHKVKHSK